MHLKGCILHQAPQAASEVEDISPAGQPHSSQQGTKALMPPLAIAVHSSVQEQQDSHTTTEEHPHQLAPQQSSNSSCK